MAINIPSLFSDIIETDQQRQTRLLTEGALLGRELTGNLRTGAGASLGQRLVATAAPTVTAIAGQLPQRREDTRQALGGMLGLDVRTQGEKVQEILSKGNASTPEGLRDLAVALQDVAPAQATALRQEAAAQTAAQSAAEAQAQLTQLQTMNALADAAQRRKDRENELETQARDQERLQTKRNSLQSFVMTSDLSPTEKNRLTTLVKGGSFDGSNFEEFYKLVSPEANIKAIGNGQVYDFDNNRFITPVTNTDGVIDVDMSSIQYDAASLFRFYEEESKIRNDDSLSTAEKNQLIAEAGQRIVKHRIPGEEWEEITRQNEDGEDVKEYISVPSGAKAIRDAKDDLRALNARNRLLKTEADLGLQAIQRIEQDISNADATGDELVGGFRNVFLSYIPGTNEFELAVDLDTLNSILGLTGLQENREGSATGASGFGQLSDREMTVLQNRIAALLQSSNRDQFLENLAVVKNFLQQQRDRASVTLEYDQYIGREPEPTPPNTVYRNDL